MAYGSWNNLLMAKSTPRTPVVGDGATEIGWTDRNPYTVIAVSESGKTVTVQEDDYVRVDDNGMSESQRYLFSPNSHGRTYTLRLTRRGWSYKGTVFILGIRQKYHDFSF
jgi:hypothetical protein